MALSKRFESVRGHDDYFGYAMNYSDHRDELSNGKQGEQVNVDDQEESASNCGQRDEVETDIVDWKSEASYGNVNLDQIYAPSPPLRGTVTYKASKLEPPEEVYALKGLIYHMDSGPFFRGWRTLRDQGIRTTSLVPDTLETTNESFAGSNTNKTRQVASVPHNEDLSLCHELDKLLVYLEPKSKSQSTPFLRILYDFCYKALGFLVGQLAIWVFLADVVSRLVPDSPNSTPKRLPDGKRYLCTTIPALVVLWGVCWMFYGESGGSGDFSFDGTLKPTWWETYKDDPVIYVANSWEDLQITGHMVRLLMRRSDCIVPYHYGLSGLSPCEPIDLRTEDIGPASLAPELLLGLSWFETNTEHTLAGYGRDAYTYQLGEPVASGGSPSSGSRTTNGSGPSRLGPASRPSPSDENNAESDTPRLQCEWCGQTFSDGRIDSLRRHIQTAHSNDGVYVCPHTDCKRHLNGFKRKDNLTQHLNGKKHRGQSRVAAVPRRVTKQKPSNNKNGAMTSRVVMAPRRIRGFAEIREKVMGELAELAELAERERKNQDAKDVLRVKEMEMEEEKRRVEAEDLEIEEAKGRFALMFSDDLNGV